MARTKTIKQLQSFQTLNENDLLIINSSTADKTGNTLVKNILKTQLTDLNNQSVIDSVNDLNVNITNLSTDLNQIKKDDIPGISYNAIAISQNTRDIGTIQGNINTIQGNISTMQTSISNLEQAIGQGGGSSSNLNNLLDGNNSGAIRSINSAIPDENYTMGENAIALGYGTKAQYNAAYAQGYETTAIGAGSHAEGFGTQALNNFSHAEGYQTITHNEGSHAEGVNTEASGRGSHAEGIGTIASEQGSHASGSYTIASSTNQTVIGRYNREMQNNMYPLIIGNGTSNSRSNALAVDWTGNVQLGFDRNAAIGTIDGDLINALAGANFISTTDTMVNVKKLFTQLTNKSYEQVLISPNHFSVYPNTSYDFSAIIPGINSSETPEIIPEDTILFNAQGSSKNGSVWLQVYTSPIQFLNGTGPKGTWVEFINSLPIAFRPVINYCTILYGIEPGLYKDNFINSLFLDNSTMNNNYIANYALLKITTDGIVSISPMNLNKKDSSSSNQLIYICNCNYTSAYSPV